MGNCLKTQLKEVVQNDNLNKLGEFRFKVHQLANPTDAQYKLVVGSYYPSSITAKFVIKGDGNFLSGGISGTSKGKEIYLKDVGDDTYFSPGEYEVAVENKYELLQFNGGLALEFKDFSFFEYMQSSGLEFSAYTASNTPIPVGILKNQFNIITLYGGFIGSTQDIQHMVNLTYLKLEGTSIDRVLDYLGSLPLLNTIQLGGNTKGSIEQFVVKKIAAGVTSNTTGVSFVWTAGFTFGGVSIQEAGSSIKLMWEPNATAGRTTVTFNGVSEVINSTTGEIIG